MLNTPIVVDIELVFNVLLVSLILMMPLALNISVNRSLKSLILIFY
jgi:hypothetical protein